MGQSGASAHAGDRLADASYYEQPGHWVAEATDDRNRARLDATLALLGTTSGPIADIGGGNGALATRGLETAALVAPVVTVDRSASALAHAPRPAVRASVDALPFRQGAFEVLVCCEVIEHLPPPVYEAARRELARCASRQVVVTVPNDEDLRRGDITCRQCRCRFHANRHLRSFRPQDMRTLLGPGWTACDIREIGPPEPRFPRYLTALAQRAGLSAPAGPHGVPECPQCGATQRLPGDPGGASRSTARPARARLRRLLRSRMPVRHRSAWLAAVFCAAP